MLLKYRAASRAAGRAAPARMRVPKEKSQRMSIMNLIIGANVAAFTCFIAIGLTLNRGASSPRERALKEQANERARAAA